MNDISPSARSRPKSLTFIILFSLIVLAAVLRFYSIGSKDLWLDEANTVAIASAEPGAMMGKLRLDSSPPLYYLLLHYWMKAFGTSEAAVRGLSALFGAGLVCAIFLVCRRLFGLEAAGFAGLLAAASPALVMYSQETRMYSLLPLLSLLAFYFFLKFLEEPGAARLALSVLFTGLAIYTHNFSFFLLPVQLVMLLLNRSPRRAFVIWLASLSALFVLYLPWLAILIFQIRNHSNYDWIAQVWNSFGLFGTLFQTLRSFSALGDHAKYLTLDLTWVGFSSLAIMAGAIASGVVYIFRNGDKPGARLRFFHVLAYLLIPLLLAAVASALSRPLYVAGRTDQTVFPAFCLAFAYLLGAIRLRPLKYLLLSGMVLLSLYSLKDYYQINFKAGDRQIAQAIRSQALPGDAVVFTGLTRASVEYYLRRSGPGLAYFSYPEEMASHLGNYSVEGLMKDPARLDSDAGSIASRIAGSGPRRVFIVYVPNRVDDFLSSGLEEGLAIRDAFLIGEFRQSLLKTRVDLYRIDR